MYQVEQFGTVPSGSQDQWSLPYLMQFPQLFNNILNAPDNRGSLE